MNETSWPEKFIAVQKGVSFADYQGRKSNILVVAPHPDDDVLGAGGTMAASAERGGGVFTVYITDGRGSPRKDKSVADDEMAVLRQKEALAALRAVGAAGGFFLSRRSEELEGEERGKITRELADILSWFHPDEFFIPAPYERHLTHQRCTRLSIDALRMAAGQKPTVLGYSLWGSFWGGKKRVARDISPFIKKKVEAVIAHDSQISYKSYHQGILGKNNYEAVFWETHEIQKSSFTEIFLDMTELLENPELTLETFIRQDFEGFIKDFIKN